MFQLGQAAILPVFSGEVPLIMRHDRPVISVSYSAAFEQYETLTRMGRIAERDELFIDPSTVANWLSCGVPAVRRMVEDHRLFGIRVGAKIKIHAVVSFQLLKKNALWEDIVQKQNDAA